MTATSTLTLWINNNGGWNWTRTHGQATRVTFTDDEVAADYIGRKGYLVLEADEDADFSAFPKAFDALFPLCEHGLSLMLCAGPGHYPMDL